MINYIGDDTNRSPIHRLFKDGEEELALEYLVQSHKSGFGAIGISEENVSFSLDDAPEGFLEEIYKSFMIAMYGVNLITIANMWKVQQVFIEKYEGPLTSFLQHANVKFEYYTFVPNSFAIPILTDRVKRGLMHPQIGWDPKVKWRSFYVDSNANANLISPFNIFINAVLHVEATETLISTISNPEDRNRMLRLRQEGKDPRMVYNLLPNDNFNRILNVIEGLHTYI